MSPVPGPLNPVCTRFTPPSLPIKMDVGKEMTSFNILKCLDAKDFLALPPTTNVKSKSRLFFKRSILALCSSNVSPA